VLLALRQKKFQSELPPEQRCIPKLLVAVRPKAILERRLPVGFGHPTTNMSVTNPTMAQRSDAQSRSETGAPAEVANNFGRHGPNKMPPEQDCPGPSGLLLFSIHGQAYLI
jgi:hypothetical protein